jgi:hypothetical protein
MIAKQPRLEPYPLPPLCRTADGGMRRIGVEFELTGIELEQLAAIVARTRGGRVEARTRYELLIRGDSAGDWGVEVDFNLLKRQARQPRSTAGIRAELQDLVERVLFVGAGQILPLEVVSPPLPMDRLGGLQPLVDALRAAGARGTGDRRRYAFGLHLNPELPALDATTILRYFRAFLCLHDWLRERARVDLTRRITPFVDPFPLAYVRRVLAPDYVPDLATLIEDYLASNPTRNRALDLLPLFSYLDDARLRRRIVDPRIKARPALHYRLPNCQIDLPGWSIEPAWRDWLEVEHMVADPARLNGLCARYALFLSRPLDRLLGSWVEQLEPWLRATRVH